MPKHRFTTIMICRDNATGKTFKKVLVHGDHPFSMTAGEGASRKDYDLRQQTRNGPADASQHKMSRQIREEFERRLALEIGIYYWFQFPKEGLFRGDLKPATVARSLYLGCQQSMHTSDFSPKILGMSQPKTVAAMKELEASGMFDTTVAPRNFDTSILTHGGLVSSGVYERRDQNRVTRLYVDQYISCYELLEPKEHVHLGRLMQLMPYKHQYVNFLCKQDHVWTKADPVPLNKYDIAELLGLSKQRADAMLDGLLSLKYERNGRQYPIVYMAEYGKHDVICINPKFAFSGSWYKRDDLLVPTYYGTCWRADQLADFFRNARDDLQRYLQDAGQESISLDGAMGDDVDIILDCDESFSADLNNEMFDDEDDFATNY